jgi:hypothetical protein
LLSYEFFTTAEALLNDVLAAYKAHPGNELFQDR